MATLEIWYTDDTVERLPADDKLGRDIMLNPLRPEEIEGGLVLILHDRSGSTHLLPLDKIKRISLWVGEQEEVILPHPPEFRIDVPTDYPVTVSTKIKVGTHG